MTPKTMTRGKEPPDARCTSNLNKTQKLRHTHYIHDYISVSLSRECVKQAKGREQVI